MFVTAMNPCPCGYYGSTEKECKCSTDAIEKYLNKEFGEQNVEKIKDYNQYIQELTKKLASKTIRDIICVLKAILKYYEEENDCKLKYKRMNITKLVNKEIKILSSKERIRLE